MRRAVGLGARLTALVLGAGDAPVRPAAPVRLAAAPFAPRQPLVVTLTDVADDSEVVVTAPADTERVRVRPFPVACAPGGRNPPGGDPGPLIADLAPSGGMPAADVAGCTVIAFGGWPLAFYTPEYVARWGAAFRVERGERRGLLYVPTAWAAEAVAVVQRRMRFTATVAVGCAGRPGAPPCEHGGGGRPTHIALQTTDAFRPGEAAIDEPPRRQDGLLHVRAGDTVTVVASGGAALRVPVVAAAVPPAPPAARAPWVRTSARAYPLRVTPNEIAVDVPVTFTNRSRAPVTLGPCSPFRLERWTADGWRGAYGSVCRRDAGPPRTIAAGVTVADTVRVRSGRDTRTFPRFEHEPLPGTYRVTVDAYHTPRAAHHQPARHQPDDPGSPLPEAARASNPFLLRLP